MGDAAWFLSERYNWYTDPNNRLVSCHISQQVMIKGMLKRHHLEQYTIAQSLLIKYYRGTARLLLK